MLEKERLSGVCLPCCGRDQSLNRMEAALINDQSTKVVSPSQSFSFCCLCEGELLPCLKSAQFGALHFEN